MNAGAELPLRGVRAFVALGANLGDRAASIREALRRLDATPGLRVLRVSSLWETAPVGPPQPDYLNAVAELDACLAPRAHLRALLRIEAELGRVRESSERFGPRTIDLDLLWQGGLALDAPGLALPHPRLTGRAFVLAPLSELEPGLVVQERAVADWLSALPPIERAGVRRWGVR